MNTFDFFVQDFFLSTRTDFATVFFHTITSFFDFSWAFILAVVLISFLIYKSKGFNNFLLFFFSIVVTIGMVYVLKNIFGVERPSGSIIEANGGSFPSYHATISAVFFIILNYIFRDSLPDHLEKSVIIVSALAVFLVSLSRIYLGVHWLSDVVFGLILAIVISYISISLFRRYNDSL